MPKIIVLASGTRGDVQPAAALSSYLNTHRYDVTICGGLNIKDLAEAYDCRFIPVGEDNEAFVAHAPEKTTRIVVEAAKLAGQRVVLSSGWAELGSDGESI